MEQGQRKEIERAFRFITENLHKPLSAREVARAAHLSEFHFQRVFHASVGESVGRFITRRRLELAALRLAYEPDRSVTDIALSSGYSSSSNFSKAFSAYFGCSPSSVREPAARLPASICTLTVQYGKDFRPEQLHTLPPEVGEAERKHIAKRWDAQVRFETLPEERTFACLAGPGGYQLAALEETWHELIARARQLGLCNDDVDAWGIAHDSPDLTAPERCRYHACVPCDRGRSLPTPLFLGSMPAGRYAVFDYQGAATEVGAAYRAIYSCWFRESSVAPVDFAPLDHYVADFPRDGQVHMEMWFRIRERR